MINRRKRFAHYYLSQTMESYGPGFALLALKRFHSRQKSPCDSTHPRALRQTIIILGAK